MGGEDLCRLVRYPPNDMLYDSKFKMRIAVLVERMSKLDVHTSFIKTLNSRLNTKLLIFYSRRKWQPWAIVPARPCPPHLRKLCDPEPAPVVTSGDRAPKGRGQLRRVW